MEIKDNGIFYVKQAVRGLDELKVDPEDWPEEREKIIKNLHDEVGDADFRHAIEDLKIDAWDKPWTKKARFIAKAAQMYDIPFGKASKRRLQKK